MSYVIDVCATCGAHAVFPFSCGHRQIDKVWTMALVVKPSPARRRELQETMALRKREPA